MNIFVRTPGLSELAEVGRVRGGRQVMCFGISSVYVRFCTTFLIKIEAVLAGDVELDQQLFLLRT